MDETEHDSHEELGDGANKRKNNELEQPRTRAKRNRYTSIACNQCKRRKIKCNGRDPCERCGNMNLLCVYAPNCCNNFKESEEFQQVATQINSLQQQVEALNTQMRIMKDQLESGASASNNLSPRLSRNSASQSSPSVATSGQTNPHRPPRFQGPPNAHFHLGVAKSNLRSIGISESDNVTDETALQADQSLGTSPPAIYSEPTPSNNLQAPDLILSITRDEAIRLVHTWRNTIHAMHPVLNMDQIFQTINLLYEHIDEARLAGITMVEPRPKWVTEDEINTLKLLFAVVLTMETGGPSDLGERLFASTAGRLTSLLLRPPELKYIDQLLLAAAYGFFRDDDVLAWRFIGLAGRMGLEIGFHKQPTYEHIFTTNAERYHATVLLWSIYVLDRRYSFGTGLPFFIQERDLDPNLLKPDSPYLSSVVELTAICSKMWPRIANLNAQLSASHVEELRQLDSEVVQWYKHVPTYLKYDPIYTQNVQNPADAQTRIILYLWKNQARIVLGQPLFFSTSALMENLNYANAVIDVAKETIRALKSFSESTFYQGQQKLYNYYFLSALAALFLPVAQAPAQFSETCREEFYMAVDFVRSMQGNSWLGRRLWRTIKALKEVGPMIGLTVPTSTTSTNNNLDAHSSAAMTMAGMAGHQPLTTPYMPQQIEQPFSGTAPAPQSETWEEMTADLMSLYENARGTEAASWDEQARFLAHQDGWSRMFRDWF